MLNLIDGEEKRFYVYITRREPGFAWEVIYSRKAKPSSIFKPSSDHSSVVLPGSQNIS